MIDEKVLIERLEEHEQYEMEYGNYHASSAYGRAIEIVNQLAEESNLTPCYLGSPCEYQNEDAKMPMEHWDNGWIPCSDKQPPKPRFKEDTYLIQQSDVVAPFSAYWNGEHWTDVLDDKIDNVIAWMPLPAPYQPKEDKQK